MLLEPPVFLNHLFNQIAQRARSQKNLSVLQMCLTCSSRDKVILSRHLFCHFDPFYRRLSKACGLKERRPICPCSGCHHFRYEPRQHLCTSISISLFPHVLRCKTRGTKYGHLVEEAISIVTGTDFVTDTN
jgi:hypothetical protein